MLRSRTKRLAVNRAELVDMAQTIFDEEVNRRELTPRMGARQARRPDLPDWEAEVHEPSGAADKPSWLEEAAEVYSLDVRVGSVPAHDAENAGDALEAAGIPCYLELSKIPQEEDALPAPTHYWRLMVPGKLNMQATSVLEREIFNPEFEEHWKTHLEALSDEELRALDPRAAFCGLFDRVERVNRVYEEELERRRNRPEKQAAKRVIHSTGAVRPCSRQYNGD